MRRRPGALEREVVGALAAVGEGLTTAQVHAALGPLLAHTTVMTTLARLSEKGVLRRTPVGRTYRYELVETAATMQASLTAHQMRRLMNEHQDKSVVLSRFVGDLSAEDAQLLARMLAGAPAVGPDQGTS